MPYSESKLFRYRYDYSAKPLIDFIKERYYLNRSEQDLVTLIIQRVSLNGKKVDPHTQINPGDWLEYEHKRQDEVIDLPDLSVLYEDEWLVAISKPDFLPVTPSTSYYYNSMAIMMKERYGNVNLSPVHRLDIETSGVLLFGKEKPVRRKIQMMFQDHRVEKRYQAIVFNKPTVREISGDLVPDESSKIYTKLVLKNSNQANSLTLIEKQETWGNYSRVWVRPITGKTNQIRAHLAAIGCPIVGDKKYYPDERIFLDWFRFRDVKRILPQVKLERQALHCELLSFISPFTNQFITIVDHSRLWQEKINSLLDKSPCTK